MICAVLATLSVLAIATIYEVVDSLVLLWRSGELPYEEVDNMNVTKQKPATITMTYRGFTAYCKYDEEQGGYMCKIEGKKQCEFEAGRTVKDAWNSFSDYIDAYLSEEVK